LIGLFLYMQSRLFVLTVIVFYALSVHAQPFPFPGNYFRNPVGIPIELSANFGELRPNHWHMGLDIRTNAKENYPVYAAAEGYIAHIGIRPQSFGRFIIINHPNGLSTLYAHLNDFFPGLEEYVTAKQYEKESWAIELDFAKGQFPVTKGAFIAYSGNTGGSQGPHLHFEIFNTRTQKRLNPLLFDFFVKDDVPPNLVKLAIYDRNKSVYEQTPQFFNLKNTDSGYVIPKIPVIKTGFRRVSFALQAYDRLSGSNNPNGIYSAHIFKNDEAQLSFVLDSIDYDETLYINAHVDYKIRYNGGAFLQHLSQLPGDKCTAYRQINGDGVLELTDSIQQAIRIEVKDVAGNVSQLNFFIQYDDSLAVEYGHSSRTNVFAPNMVNMMDKPGFELYLPEGSLYDTVSPVYFVTAASLPYSFSDIHHAGDASVPLHEDAIVRLKLKRPVPAAGQDKLLILRSDRRGNSVRKAVWQEQWVSARFGGFGTFQIIADVTPPRVNDPGKGDTINLSAATRIIFSPADDYGIKSFRAALSSCTADILGYHCIEDSLSRSRWLRFTNDKSRNWIYRFDEQCPYGVHQLKVTIEDIAGNITVKEWWIKRFPYTPPPPKKKTGKKTNEKAKKSVKKKN